MHERWWEAHVSDRKEYAAMATTLTPTARVGCPSLEKRQSALFELRSLAPRRRMSHLESLRLAEAQANKLRDILGVTTDFFATQLVECLPRVLVRTVEDIPASGASFWGNGTWHIHIHADEPVTHRRLTLLHELKHIIDHPIQKYVYDERAFVVYGEREIIADYFAACVLVPENRLRAAYAITRNHRELASHFGVSTRRLLHRLSEVGLTDTITSIPQRTIYSEHHMLNPKYEKERRTA